ncbi:hypothetical protein LTR62_005203 [Meristemomyces frigidus]|uniref:tRNA-intron lyase n=1 Tax=Meristemomyces frigidus TaxID=1508187 RepID=A0AAN7YFP5_9PEZI|nr:hypothetical protein LTR62_005203 [Meristemomyces frigidus]
MQEIILPNTGAPGELSTQRAAETLPKEETLLPPTDDVKPKRQSRNNNNNRKKARNFNQIHSKPLPLETYPLPAFHPSNPISLLRLCYTFLLHTFYPPSSHILSVDGYPAHFSLSTRSVHVTDPAAVKALWEMGFFGKGSLSRSEPTWLERERELQRQARAGGGKGGFTAAEAVTRQRREERRLFKLERARVEREGIERQRAVERGELGVEEVLQGDEGAGGQSLPTPPPDNLEHESKGDRGEAVDSELLDPLLAQAESMPLLSSASTGPPNNTTLLSPDKAAARVSIHELEQAAPDIKNQEHLQLTLVEAFFLSYALGVLDITVPPPDQTDTQTTKTVPHLPPLDLLNLFAKTSATTKTPPTGPSPLEPPTIAINSHPLHARAVSHAIATAPLLRDPTSTTLKVPFTAAPLTPQPEALVPQPAFTNPNNPFLLSYITYHHFRSLGWVIRPGAKFGVDYLLYNRGPVFSHAEFGVLVIPAYTDTYWSSTAEGRKAREAERGRDWWWLHCANRVQSAVHKTLVLCYVDVPAPLSGDDDSDGGKEWDVKALLSRYKVREFVVKRWLVNRSRD